MSARSMARAHTREALRAERKRKRRVLAGTVAAIGAGAVLAPSAGAATFVVNSNADTLAPTPCDATCTLRDAVNAANADPLPDTITFASTVTGQIKLSNANNPFPINSAMTINGPGPGALSIDGRYTGNSRLLYVYTDVNGAPYEQVSISGLTISNADSGTLKGAAIYSYQSNLALDNMAIRGNTTEGSGGGVYSQDGSLSVTNSTFTGNSAGSGGGAIYTDNDNGPASGGTSRLVVTDSTFRGNNGGYGGGAIYVDDETDSALIARSTFVGNTAGQTGGALRFYGPETGKIEVVDSTITGNTAGRAGGGISVYGQYDKEVEVSNSTIAGNTAGDVGGGVYQYAFDDIAYAGTDVIKLTSTVVAGNSALRGVDVAQRPPGVIPSPVIGSIPTSFSLIGVSAGAPITPTGPNILDVDPQLAPLADNGGPTRTMLPADGSPVIDAGIANGLAIDQRGLPRIVKRSFSPAADGTDIGAVEVQDAGLEGATVTAKKKQGQKGKKVLIKVDVGAQEQVMVDATGKVKAGKENVKLKPIKGKLVGAGEAVTLKLKPKSKSGTKAILNVLGNGKKAKATLSVKLTDPAGNTTSKKPKVKLTG